MDPGCWKWGGGEGGTQCGQFGRGTPDAGDEKITWWTVVGRNGPRPACRAFGEGERAVGMHQTQDMIRKEGPDGQGAENAWGGGGSSGCRHYASGVKGVFANASR